MINMFLLPIRCGKCHELLKEDDLVIRDFCNELSHFKCNQSFEYQEIGTFERVGKNNTLYTYNLYS